MPHKKEASSSSTEGVVVVAFVETYYRKHENDDDWTTVVVVVVVFRLLLRLGGCGRGRGQTAAGSATADRRRVTGNGKIDSSSRRYDDGGRGQRAAARVGRCW